MTLQCHQPEPVGDFFMRPSFHVVEDEDLARAIGEPTDRRLEIHGDRGVGGVPRRLSEGELVVLDPLPLALATPMAREHHVHRQTMQPGREGALGPEGRELLPRPDEDVLGQVIGQVVPRHPPHQRVDPRHMPPVQPLERPLVAPRRRLGEGGFDVEGRRTSQGGRERHGGDHGTETGRGARMVATGERRVR